MKTQSGLQRIFKRLNQAAITALLLLGVSAGAQAAVSDALTITITPNAYYAVDIDTTNVALDMGTVALGASTQTVRPSTVTIQSTFALTDLRIQGSISGGWTFDADSTTSELDALAAWATFTSIARSSAPAQTGDYFTGTSDAASSDLLSANNRYVGTSATDGINRFENGSGFDSVDMDDRAPNHQSHLWLYFRLPSATTNTTAKNVTILVTAVAPN